MFEIVDEFANSNEALISAFIPALEKMLKNGYDDDDLQTKEWDSLILHFQSELFNCSTFTVEPNYE